MYWLSVIDGSVYMPLNISRRLSNLNPNEVKIVSRINTDEYHLSINYQINNVTYTIITFKTYSGDIKYQEDVEEFLEQVSKINYFEIYTKKKMNIKVYFLHYLLRIFLFVDI